MVNTNKTALKIVCKMCKIYCKANGTDNTLAYRPDKDAVSVIPMRV